jgi:hypothetical protein
MFDLIMHMRLCPFLLNLEVMEGCTFVSVSILCRLNVTPLSY